MKHQSFLIAALLCSPFALHSCMDYDDPGAELGVAQSIGSSTHFVGDVDFLDYEKEIPLDTLKAARKQLEEVDKVLGASKSAQYMLRGGKNNEAPAAHAYQYQYNLGPDAYAQYLVVPHSYFPYANNANHATSYSLTEQFNGGPRGSYSMVKNALMPLLNHPAVDKMPEIKAINLLYYCLSAQEMADLSGPFSYLEDKKNSLTPRVYNDVRTIYYGIVANLDNIVKCLKHFDQRPKEYQDEIKDILALYNETSRAQAEGEAGIKSYIALANSLKLRMAMHIVKVEPETAQKWAEEAVKEGVIENVEDQQGIFNHITGSTHPLVQIMAWNDTRLCASLESILMSLEHPTTKYLWKNNQVEIGELPANSRIVGIRAGEYVEKDQTNSSGYGRYSTFDAGVMGTAPLYYVKYAEVCFLRAEGALRGWNMGGTAEHFYNEGIRHAYYEDPLYIGESPYKELVETYLQKAEATPYVQVDPMNKTKWNSVTHIGVKWNEADDREKKLEKIITQKYIAIFPLSTEAWTEMRRTGYPKVFPVLNTDEGDGSIAQGDMIRRIPWNATTPEFQAIVNTSGIPALGGDDFQATRLWWDKEGANF